MEPDEARYRHRLRRIRWGMIAITAVALVVVEAYYYWRGVPVLDDVIDWAVGMAIAVTLVSVGFLFVRRVHRDLVTQVEKRHEAESILREGEAHYRALVERANDGIAILQDGVVQYANPMVSRITGYDFDEITSTPFVDFLHPSERPRVLERYERRMSGEVAPSVYETIVVGKDGREIWVEINAGLITFRGGPADLAFVRDITERKRMEASLRDISEKMQRLHETARRLATCESEDEVYRVAAEAAETTLAFSMCSVDAVENGVLRVKATSSQLLPGMSQSRSLSDGGLAAETHRTGKVFVFGSLDEVPQANPVDASIASGISVPIGDIGVLQIVSTERDAFTEEDARLLDVLARHAASAIRRIRLQSELERQASRDPLTDAYNRRYFTQTIEQEIARSRRYEHPIALLMIDVNRFKEINDRFGHLIGDRILLEVAALLRSQVREADVVVRYGGDEFLIVQPETGGDCTSTIARIQAGLTEWNANSQLLDFPLTLAIGAACWQPSAERPFEVVLNEADRRMYENKHEADSA